MITELMIGICDDDMINHLIALKTLEENQQYDSLRRYLDELLEALTHLLRRQYDVGNEIISTILNYYLIPLQDECSIRVRGCAGELPHILQKDLCVLVSNLVHNAADAVMQAEDKQMVFVIEEGTEYLRLYIENTFSGERRVDRNGVIRKTMESV